MTSDPAASAQAGLPGTPSQDPATQVLAGGVSAGVPAGGVPAGLLSVGQVLAARPDAVALAAALVTVTLWGSAFVAIRAADLAFSPGAIAFGRLVVSSALLGAVALVRREPLPRPRDVIAIAGYGVLWLGIYSVALNAAERRVDAGTAAMIINTGPILIAVLAGVFLREGFPRRLFAGCAAAFGGCVLIGVTGAGSDSGAGPGIALCVVAALAYAVAVVVQKPVLARVSPFQVTWLGLATATIACSPFAPQLVRQVAHAHAGAIGWIIYLGAGPTALGFVTWTFALRRRSAGQLASVAYLIPVVAIALGWAVLGQVPAWLALAGGGLCLVGVLIARRPAAATRQAAAAAGAGLASAQPDQ
jgi:drug/metabolite transporter (DMT)-like permease